MAAGCMTFKDTSALVTQQSYCSRSMAACSHGDQVVHVTDQELLGQVGSFSILALLQHVVEVVQLGLQCHPILAC